MGKYGFTGADRRNLQALDSPIHQKTGFQHRLILDDVPRIRGSYPGKGSMGPNDESCESSHSGIRLHGGDVGNSKGFSLGSSPLQNCNKVGNIPCSSFNVQGVDSRKRIRIRKSISIIKGGISPTRSKSKNLFSDGEGSTLRSNQGDRQDADSAEAGDVGETRLMAFEDGAGSHDRVHPSVDLNVSPMVSANMEQEGVGSKGDTINLDLEIDNTIEVGLCVGIDASGYKDQVREIIAGEGGNIVS
ncbi:hypothetical protein L1987_33880 [Smallanthus sonchifolius]|uniref:Uncharacterized protein n=1 Tax=Smallanthus sonchifolius TaxID=185202 RepID=A0ACB9HTG6_9ASTR|nr:hypothetical protein L1987_33880 [Smallanthus sonchifolius]